MRFHFKTQQGIRYNSNEQSAAVGGTDGESHQRDLFESIEHGDFPSWNLKVQIMPESEADSTEYNPFDLTNVWPHGDYPLIDVGTLELDRNPSNYFAEVEQAAFSPANVVPGIGHSPDKMLRFRIFSYADTQRCRLWVNHESLDVNRPRCPMHNYHRAGQMRMDTADGAPNYEPNSFGGPVEDATAEPALPINGSAARYDHRDGNNGYTQAGNLFRLMPADEQQRLITSIVGAMRNVRESIQRRQVEHFRRADPAYGQGAARGLGILKAKAPEASYPPSHAGSDSQRLQSDGRCDAWAANRARRPAHLTSVPTQRLRRPVGSSTASRHARIDSRSESKVVDGGARGRRWRPGFWRNEG